VPLILKGTLLGQLRKITKGNKPVERIDLDFGREAALGLSSIVF